MCSNCDVPGGGECTCPAGYDPKRRICECDPYAPVGPQHCPSCFHVPKPRSATATEAADSQS